MDPRPDGDDHLGERLALLPGRLERIGERMAAAADRTGREVSEVRLLPVSKTVPMPLLERARDLGVTEFGESRVQELLAKATQVGEGAPDSGPAPRWVMIGPLQTNKARDLARVADEIQTVDSAKVAQALQRRLEQADRRMTALLQVNTSGEEAKSGCAAAEVEGLLEATASCDRLEVRGLMTIATRGGDEAETRRCFAALREVRNRLSVASGVPLPELSMGMSGDLELAIEEGATVIRVGSAIFGARPPVT